MRDLRADVFRHIESLHLGFFDSYPVGRLVTRATNDVENVAEMFSQGIVALVTDVIKMIGFAVALFLVNPKLALATFSVVPFLAPRRGAVPAEGARRLPHHPRAARAHQRHDPGDA